MGKLIKKLKEFYIMWNARRIWKRVEKDEATRNAKLSQEDNDRSLEVILSTLREHEAEEEKKRRVEEQELIRYGRIYKSSLKRRKYVVLAAVLVLALSFSINCFGSVGRMFHKLDLKIFNREREVVDTDGLAQLEGTSEEEAFAEIEELCGCYPVRLGYLPEGTGFLEINIVQNVPKITLLYGNENEIHIKYDILPNYRESSATKDIEDSLQNIYRMRSGINEVEVKEYLTEGEMRWLVQFEHENFYYLIYIMNVEPVEMQKIVEEIWFL